MSPAKPHQTPPAPAAAHLPAAVLRQYAAGTLTPAERRQVERHTLGCALCADALEGYQQAAPAAISPAALAELRQRLHARVADEPARAPRGGAWWMAAAAAVALLLAVLGLWQWPREREQTPIAATTPSTKQGPAAAAPAASAETAAVAAATDTVPLAGAIAAAPSALAEQSYAFTPTPAGRARVRTEVRPRRAVAAAPQSDVIEVDLSDKMANGTGVATADAPVAAEVPAPSASRSVAAAPVMAPTQVAEPAADSSDAAKGALQGRVAGVAVTRMAEAKMKAVAPAAAPLPREESVKRKSDMPAAPALAPFPSIGYPAFRNYLLHEQQRPESGQRASGTVKLKFTIDADGSIQNIQVTHGINEEQDNEAIRLICEGPAWRPGIVNGRRAAQTVRIEVPFR